MALTNAEKQRRWRERHPEAVAEREAARRRLTGGRLYRRGRRGQWGVYRLYDPMGADADIPRCAVAYREPPALWQRREEIPGRIGEWLRRWDTPPRIERLLGGIPRALALRLAEAESRRLREVLRGEWVGLAGLGGLRGAAGFLAGWRRLNAL